MDAPTLDTSHVPTPTHPTPTSPARRGPRSPAEAAPCNVRQALVDEWERLRHDPDAVERVRSWALVDVDDLEDLLRHAGRGCRTTPDTNAVLHRLLEIGRCDDLAARIVLQRILPGLLATIGRHTARRVTARSSHPDDMFGELIGNAWIAIRCYDLTRRPRCLAAALLWGAEHRTFFTRGQRRPAPELATDLRTADLPAVDDASDSVYLDDLLDDAARAGMDSADLALVRRLLDGASTEGLANELGVTARTVRNHRRRATDRLRQLASARDRETPQRHGPR